MIINIVVSTQERKSGERSTTKHIIKKYDKHRLAHCSQTLQALGKKKFKDTD